MSKTEERLKLLLDEYLDVRQQKQQREVLDHVYSIFWWGVIFGTLISYMSIIPLLFGVFLGYVSSKKEWLVFELWMEKWYPWLRIGQKYWIRFWNNQEQNRKT